MKKKQRKRNMRNNTLHIVIGKRLLKRIKSELFEKVKTNSVNYEMLRDICRLKTIENKDSLRRMFIENLVD
jgi:hypothetical protein